MKKTFSVISLGCFRNTYDSDIVAAKLTKQGFVFKEAVDNCHTLIVNTCGFIDKAKQESLSVIQQALDLKKGGKVKEIIVFGCLVGRYKQELKKEFPQIDQWQGIEKFGEEFIARKLNSASSFLKICEGCLNRCSFCAIPLIKGSLASRSIDSIIREVKYLDKKSIKELNIIGQDITSWGKDFKKKDNLVSLLRAILRNTKSIKWVRLIYTHPRHISDSLIDLIGKSTKICKYIDLPIQHINDKILKAMNRRITKKEILGLIKKIRKRIPNCVIRTSVIVGFPGETEIQFKELLSFLKDIEFDRLGAFTYSREEDTPAYNLLNQVHSSTKKRRLKEVMLQQQEIARKKGEKFIGKELNVLIEDKEGDYYVGRTQYDAPEVDGEVFIKRKGLRIGDFYKVKITDSLEYDLVAK